MIKKIFFSIIYIFIGIFSSLFIFFLYEYKNIIKNNELTNNIAEKVIIFDKNNDLIKTKSNNYFFIADIPKYIIDAFLCAEDLNFFSHRGISITGILRSIIINIKNRKFLQGGSTITQQYIKLRNNNLKKTFIRKIKEQFQAIIFESIFTKEEIFYKYLNILNFGNNIVGIKNAVKIFFNKDLKNITISEAAALAGIIQIPQKYNPINNIDACIKRRNIILFKMKNNKKITENEYKIALSEKLIINKNIENLFLVDLEKIIYDFCIKNNLNLKNESFIFTTFDIQIQNKVEKVIKNNLLILKDKYGEIDATVVVIDTSTNEILAAINNIDINKKSIISINNYRQVGSTIKPLVAYYAFLNNDFPETIYIDEEIKINNWIPRNNNRKFKGEMTIEDSIIFSNNILPIKILMKFGIQNFYDLLLNLKIFNIPGPYYSLALGCLESTPLFLASFISSIFTGKLQNAFFIKTIRNITDSIIYKNKNNKTIFSYDYFKMKIIKKILEKSGKRICSLLNIKYIPLLIAKTGTTNDSKECWFICATEKYSLAICLEKSKNSLSKNRLSSIRHAAKIGIDIINIITID